MRLANSARKRSARLGVLLRHGLLRVGGSVGRGLGLAVDGGMVGVPVLRWEARARWVIGLNARLLVGVSACWVWLGVGLVCKGLLVVGLHARGLSMPT